MAMCLATKRLGQVRITAQFLKASLRTRLFFRILSDGICILFNIFIIWVCIQSIRENLEFPEISPTLGVSRPILKWSSLFALPLPAGGVSRPTSCIA